MTMGVNANVPLRTPAVPAEVLVDVTATLIADLTASHRGQGKIVVFNLGAASIFVGLSGSNAAGPVGLATTNGFPIVTGGALVLDDVGGLALWGIAAAKQTAGVGTRPMAVIV
jgi:hypothetical protein